MGIRVIVVGDPGPIRTSLLLRTEITVLWAMSLQEVHVILEKTTDIQACIVSPRFHAMTELEFLRLWLRDIPAIVLRRGDDRSRDNERLPDDITFVLDVTAVDETFARLGQLTDLAFAKDARVPLSAKASLELQDLRLECAVIDVSASGIAVRPVPELSSGAEGQISIRVDEDPAPITADVQVVRTMRLKSGQRLGGLKFVAWHNNSRARLDALIRKRTASTAELHDTLEHIVQQRMAEGAVTTPSPLNPTADGDTVALEEFPELAPLTAPSPEAWIESLKRQLTPVEQTFLEERCGPRWVAPALRLRVQLARDDQTGQPHSSETLISAYRFLEQLELETAQAPADLSLDAAHIRSALLRHLLRREAVPGRGHHTP